MDVFCEYIVKVKKNPLEMALSVLGVIVGVILLGLSMPFLFSAISSIVLLIDAAAIYGVYILITHFNVEYEYILTNGDLDVDKIVAKRKRKRMLSFSTKEFEIVAPYKSGQNYANVLDLGTRNYENAYYAVFSKDGQRKTLIFNPPQKMIEAMKTYSPRTVHLKGEPENY